MRRGHRGCLRLDARGCATVVDAFIVNDELTQLEWRLTEHSDFVTHFVAVESNVTHTGRPKPAHVRENWPRFRRWHHQLTLLTVGEPPAEVLDDPRFAAEFNGVLAAKRVPRSYHFSAEQMRGVARERWARTVALRHVQSMLASGQLPPSAIVSLVSDADEIYDRQVRARACACAHVTCACACARARVRAHGACACARAPS